MQHILSHGGIAFFIIKFTQFDETYLLDANILIHNWYKQFEGYRKSMSYKDIAKKGHLIPFKYTARIHYLPIIDEIYRSEEHTSELQSRGHLVCRLLLE